MRVLVTAGFLGRNGETDGVATTYRHLIPLFERCGYAVDVVSYGPEDDVVTHGAVRVFTHRPRLPVEVDPRRRIDAAFSRTTLARKLAREAYTLVQSSSPDTMGLWAAGVARRRDVPFIALYHTALADYARIRAERLAGRLAGRVAWHAMEWWLRRTFNAADLVLAPSRCVADQLAGWLRPRADVLGRGVDGAQFHPRKRRRTTGATRALYVGRVAPEKNLALLGRIFADRDDVELSIVGDGPALEGLREELPWARFHGRLVGEELAQAYADADFFVFPSRTDTLGNVVLEAMASGLPVVVTDGMGPKELVDPQVTGFVASSDDDFARAVDRLAADADRRRSMGLAARRFAESRTWEAIFSELLGYYEWVLAHRRLRGGRRTRVGRRQEPAAPRRRRRAPTSSSTSRSLCVLDITEFFGETSGGVKTYLSQKVRFTEQRGDVRHVLIVPGRRSRVVESQGARWHEVRAPRIPRLRPYRLMIAAAAISRIIQEERPDIIEVGSHFAAPWLVAGCAEALGVPLVWFCHSNLPLILDPYPERRSWLKHEAAALGRRYLGRLSRLCRATLAPSEALADDLERLGARNVERVSLGVEVELFDPARCAPAAETRRRLGLTEGPLVLHAGRVTTEKAVDLLIEAWPAIEAATAAHLVVVGDGPAKERLRARSRGLRVHWLPYEPHRGRLADLMTAADLYVAPSVVETFGLAALEAMACDAPVLSADRGAVAEHVRRSAAGALFESGSAAALSDRCVELLAESSRARGRHGHTYVAGQLSWRSAFERIFGVYERVLRAAACA